MASGSMCRLISMTSSAFLGRGLSVGWVWGVWVEKSYPGPQIHRAPLPPCVSVSGSDPCHGDPCHRCGSVTVKCSEKAFVGTSYSGNWDLLGYV